MTIEATLEANHNRRMANEDRFLGRRERRELEAEHLVGEVIRSGRTVYYINERRRDGAITGRVREFIRFVDATDFLIRNYYV